MSEKLANRVGQIIVGSVHALLDKIADQAPEAMMEQAMREVDQVCAEVRQELGMVSANRHLAQQQHANLNQRHLELSSHIELGLGQQREDLARVAVARQLDIEAQLPVVEMSLANLAKQEAELKGYVDALLGKKREMESTLASFRASRVQNVGASDAAYANPLVAKLDNASSAFNRIFERQTGLSSASHNASMEQLGQLKQLDELVRENKIAERLAQIKAAQS